MKGFDKTLGNKFTELIVIITLLVLIADELSPC